MATIRKRGNTAGKLAFDARATLYNARPLKVVLRITNFLWNEQTGLPIDAYGEQEVSWKVDAVFGHVFRAYPTVPSPFFQVAV